MSDTAQDFRPGSGSASAWRNALWFDRRLDLLPILFVFGIVAYFSVDLPHSDDWQLMAVIERFRNGTLDWDFLSRPFNGHKMIVSYPVMAGLAMATHWNTLVMEFAGLLFLLAGWAAFRVDGRHPSWRLGLAALVFWGMNQYTNFLSLWQMAFFLSLSLSLWALRLLAFERVSAPAFVAALGMGVAASLAYGFGMSVWPAVLCLLAARREWGRLGAALLVALATAALFLHDNHGGSGGAIASRGGFLHVAAFFLSAWGVPVAPMQHGFAIAVGALGVVLLAFCLWKGEKADRFLLAVGFLGVTGLAVLAYSRCEADVSWSFGSQSRYGTAAMLVWIPVALLLPVRTRVGVAVAAALALMAVARDAAKMPYLPYFQNMSKECAYQVKNHIPPGALAYNTTGTEGDVKRYVALLEEWHYSLFRK